MASEQPVHSPDNATYWYWVQPSRITVGTYLVLYVVLSRDPSAGTRKGGDTLVMQDDGNLVIYAVGRTGRDGGGRRVLPKVVWESGTGEDGGVNRIRP